MLERAWTLDNLIDAWYKVKKVSHWKEITQRYEEDLLLRLTNLRNNLLKGTAKLGTAHNFVISERGKNRLIYSYDLDTRVAVRSFIDNILLPLVKPKLIYDNGASLKGKGLDFHRDRIITHLKSYYNHYGNGGYILTIDFKKFFDNIDHEKLKQMFADVLQDQESSDFVNSLIDTYQLDISCLSDKEIQDLETTPFDSVKFYDKKLALEKHGAVTDKEPIFLKRGVFIGGQLSQIAGILYPYKLDNFIKIVKGEKYYGRYMDDLYIISQSKEHLRSLLQEITEKCKEYGIFLNQKKTQITPINRFFTICKIQYLVKENGDIVRKPCKDSFNRERKAIRKFRKNLDESKMTIDKVIDSYLSWRGNMTRFDCKTSIKNMDAYFIKTIDLTKEKYKDVRNIEKILYN